MIKIKKKKIVKIGTHNDVFHADELTAISLFKIFINNEIEIVRTRDLNILEKCNFVLDVGGKFDNEKWFDHHQHNFNEFHENNKVKMATAGLILRYLFLKNFISREEYNEFLRIIIPIDATDNGIEGYDSEISNIVKHLSPSFKEIGLEDELFHKALSLIENLFRRIYFKIKCKIEAKEIVEKAIKAHDGKNYVFYEIANLPSGIESLIDKKQVAISSGKNQFNVRIVPDKPESFGLCVEKEKIDQAISLMKNQPLFVHTNKFFLACNTLEDAIDFAENLKKVTSEA
jgi:uncharacterized UPF0160 family protein